MQLTQQRNYTRQPTGVTGVQKNVTLHKHFMERYRNLSGDSGVSAFEIGVDFIVVEFRKGGPYFYSYRSAGRTKVEQMKVLARKGQGLGTFINKYVKHKYERKSR